MNVRRFRRVKEQTGGNAGTHTAVGPDIGARVPGMTCKIIQKRAIGKSIGDATVPPVKGRPVIETNVKRALLEKIHPRRHDIGGRAGSGIPGRASKQETCRQLRVYPKV